MESNKHGVFTGFFGDGFRNQDMCGNVKPLDSFVRGTKNIEF